MIDYYKLAIATGLSDESAKLFATAMTHKDKPSIDHLRVIK